MSNGDPGESGQSDASLSSIEPAEFEGEVQVIIVVSGAAPMPTFGRLPVVAGGKRCVVKASKPPAVVHAESSLEWPLESRDWCLEVVFSRLDVDARVLDSHHGAIELLDVALEAWNQATAWVKARDRSRADGRIAPWPPRLGRVNVLRAAVADSFGRVAFHTNPNNLTLLELAPLAPFADMLITNGPAASPLPDLTDRLQESLDLLNHGFVRESFISAFAIFEGKLREVLSERIRLAAGVQQRPEDPVVKVVRKANFRDCLTSLASRPDVGWRSMEADDPALYAELLEAYAVRNQVMHHGARLDRRGAENGLEIIFSAAAWICGQLGLAADEILPAPNGAVPRFALWEPGDDSLSTPVDGVAERVVSGPMDS